MAGQQQHIIDTIFNMKRRLLRKDDSSDSDEADSPYHKRTHGLKRKAQYMRAGKPDALSEAPPYKKRIEHAGYHRYILHRNPPRFDPDGDIVEPGDEYEDEDELSEVEENPYADIKLEELLAPLASAADLPAHPSMSIAYTSKHLTNLTAEAGASSRREQVVLWQLKGLFTKILGDLSYMPTSLMDLDRGDHLQESVKNGENGENGAKSQATNGESHQAAAGNEIDTEAQERHEVPDVAMMDAEHANGVPPQHAQPDDDTEHAPDQATAIASVENGVATNGAAHDEDASRTPHQNGERAASELGDDASETASQQTAHRMTTRARANVNSDPSPPASPSSLSNVVHPMYTFSLDSLPDRDLGLPAAEAEDTRFLLHAIVQKQEEISRATTDLYTGMLRGERMRQDVFKWCKAEGHVGEMSDGEDWYDREEWNLDQGLMKGRDEEEDEQQVQGKKSTRARRKPEKEKEDR